jgi:MtN3 and saliva related transmembrane protein
MRLLPAAAEDTAQVTGLPLFIPGMRNHAAGGWGRDETIQEATLFSGGEKIRMKQIVAVIFGIGLLGNALLFVPQAMAVWRKKTDEGVSLVTFGGFCLLQILGVIHGFYEHDNSLVIGLGASFLTCGTVTALTTVYRLRRLRAQAS